MGYIAILPYPYSYNVSIYVFYIHIHVPNGRLGELFFSMGKSMVYDFCILKVEGINQKHFVCVFSPDSEGQFGKLPK